MPDVFDSERGLKNSLTDKDYQDYQDGNLSDDFYARRNDGSIANRVDIRRLDEENGEESEGLDAGSAAIGAAIAIVVGGAIYVAKKLWGWISKKKIEETHQHGETATQVLASATGIAESVQEEQSAEVKLLTEDEVNRELMKIIIGMAEIVDGKNKVAEGVETLSNAEVVDRATLLEKLSDPKTLERFNAYLNQHPQLVEQNQVAICEFFGHSLSDNGHYVPLSMSDIEQQKSKTEVLQEE